MSEPVRPERGILLELDALLSKLEQLANEGTRARYDNDELYRWSIQRLWIAVGNEAASYRDLGFRGDPWNVLAQLRNRLAHRRLPDVDDDEVWRMTVMRSESLRSTVRDHVR